MRHVVAALDAPHPPPRYVITPLMHAMNIIVRLLPPRVMDRVMLWFNYKAWSRAGVGKALHPASSLG